MNVLQEIKEIADKRYDYEDQLQEISRICNIALPDNPVKKAISDFCLAIRSRCLAKFDKGRAEHGEDFSQINFFEEIMNEFADAINYYVMYNEQNKFKK